MLLYWGGETNPRESVFMLVFLTATVLFLALLLVNAVNDQ
ncbi:hypothetical protein CHCC5025_1158 [Bacillus licheniformis]|nr:hypothetical protein CHCC5025_1158 [Bacillus licheniformis]TWJ82591.1 hypothetical protein CHCC20497_2061 [Bacillus paralicheniformis]TWK70936.1 hypothetical protein CHCC20342_2603 [Bacillus licheniformis]TWM96201.1 hypothetical protein CHCC14596_2335 [Bacillus licheniformis]